MRVCFLVCIQDASCMHTATTERARCAHTCARTHARMRTHAHSRTCTHARAYTLHTFARNRTIRALCVRYSAGGGKIPPHLRRFCGQLCAARPACGGGDTTELGCRTLLFHGDVSARIQSEQARDMKRDGRGQMLKEADERVCLYLLEHIVGVRVRERLSCRPALHTPDQHPILYTVPLSYLLAWPQAVSGLFLQRPHHLNAGLQLGSGHVQSARVEGNGRRRHEPQRAPNAREEPRGYGAAQSLALALQ